MSAPLADRTVLVTGGSRGIGSAVVEAVHRDGAHVIVHSSRVETGRAVREALGAERVHALAGDLAEVVAFLASGRSPHTTGATIDITGADYVR